MNTNNGGGGTVDNKYKELDEAAYLEYMKGSTFVLVII